MSDSPERAGDDGSRITISPRLVAGVVLASALALLIFQNTRSTKVEWLVFETEQPLWVVLLVTAVVALVVAELVGGARRRRQRKAEKR